MFPYELWYMGCWSFLNSVGPRFLFFYVTVIRV